MLMQKYYVTFKEKGLVNSIFIKLNDNTGYYTEVKLVLKDGSLKTIKESALIENLLLDSVWLSSEQFEYFKKCFLESKEFYYLGKPVNKENFNDPGFLESFKFLLRDGFTGQEVKKNKSKTKYILYYGEEEIVVGYSKLSPNHTAGELLSAISEKKGILVENKRGQIIAFYNPNVVEGLSFSIHSLE